MYLNIEKIVVNNSSFEKLVESINLYQNQLITISNDCFFIGTDSNLIKVGYELHQQSALNYIYKINWNGSLLRFICYEEIRNVFNGGNNNIVIASFAFDGFAIFGSILIQTKNNNITRENKEIETNIIELIHAIEICFATNNMEVLIMIYRFIDKTNVYLTQNINKDLLKSINQTINKIDKISSMLDEDYIIKFKQLKSKLIS